VDTKRKEKKKQKKKRKVVIVIVVLYILVIHITCPTDRVHHKPFFKDEMEEALKTIDELRKAV
jgi:hypothetical protein